LSRSERILALEKENEKLKKPGQKNY